MPEHVGGVIALQVMEVNEEHPSNATDPIVVTLAGISIDAKLRQLANVAFSILVMLFGRVTEVKLVQLEKQPPPMYVILLWKEIEDNCPQLLNAYV